MRKIVSHLSLVTVVVFACVCLIPTISHAQPLVQQTLYDVKTVKTISGTVKDIRPMKTMGHALLVATVETAKKQRYAVNLGPVWYFIKQGFGIKEGDKVEVTGSDVSNTGIFGTIDLLAAKVIKGDAVLELRDSNGIPYWAGSGER